jgi:hypothetical protein
VSSFQELAEALRGIAVEEVPEGWQTARQIAEEGGVSHERACHVVRKAFDAGLLDRKLFRITTGLITKHVPHYRKKQKQ